MNQPLTVIVSGMIAGDPYQGGAAWAVLQYVLGLEKLGCDVYLVEPVDLASLSPCGTSLNESVNARYFQRVVADFNLSGRAALVCKGSRQSFGLTHFELCAIAERTDVLLNISGMLEDEELTGRIPIRAYLDLDPAFIQLWAAQGIDMRLDGHTHFVTIGRAIGLDGCLIPTGGRTWLTTNQPIVLDRWPVAGGRVEPVCTTVGHWRGYGSIEHDGVFYGQKVHSLREIIALPTYSRAAFLLAMAIHPDEKKDLAALAHYGWRIVDPLQVAATPQAYQEFIQQSWAEIAIAKSGYVKSQCGWFSDRSICYLASGRPVLAQDTGFSRFLPTGEGLLVFRNLEEAAEHLRALERDYEFHARKARQIAKENFDSNRVLSRLLRRLGVRA